MNCKLHKKTKNIVIAIFVLLSSQSVLSQNFFFIEHKPSGNKMQVCDGELGSPVTSRPNANSGECVQWEKIPNGEFFHLRNVQANKLIKPDTIESGSPISIQPLSWTGNWTQWSFEERGDGFGHIVNKATGKLIFLNGKNHANIQQQPSSWRGNFTRWRFVPVNGVATPGPSPSTPPHPNGSPSLSCGFTPSINETIIVNQTQELLVSCSAAFGAGVPTISASFNGVTLDPISIDNASSTAPLRVVYEYKIDLNAFTDTANEVVTHLFSATANGPGSAGPTLDEYEVKTIFQTDLLPPTPTPTGPPCPSFPPHSTLYEAEDGRILGSAAIYSDAAASGGEGVAFISSQDAGVSITYDSSLPSTHFVVSYASRLSGKISYRINGEDKGDINFSSTGAWVGNYSKMTINAEIPKDGILDIFFDAGDAPLNIDSIDIGVRGFGGCPTPYPPARPSPTPTLLIFTPPPSPTPAVGPFAEIDVISNTLISGKADGPLPKTGEVSLRTPILGLVPKSAGFAFDITAESVVWRSGDFLVTTGLIEYFCSENGGLSYKQVQLVDNSAANICSGDYVYFFRYEHPNSLNDNPAHRWIYTASFTSAEPRIDPNDYPSFVDGTANRMRFRHPISGDGVTSAVLDAQHNADLLRNLDRYTMWVDDRPGNVRLNIDLNGNLIRNESLRRDSAPNTQQFFGLSQNPGFDDAYSYGQVIQFEFTAVAGRSQAQTYNDFAYYTVGLGWNNYGDLRLNSAGRAGTTMIFSDDGRFIDLERNSVFSQPVTTLNTEKAVDDYILGHHLFHGIDPNNRGSIEFGEVKIGDSSCGDCHFRDGRGTQTVSIDGSGILPPPIYGVGLLMAIDGRDVGLGRDGRFSSVEEYIGFSLSKFHGVDPTEAPERIKELLAFYPNVLSVPNRLPQFTDDPAVNAGSDLFMEVGCADCHTPIQKTKSSVPAFDNLTIRPFTDMKIWDLGEGEFRTTALWGLGQNIKLLGHNNKPVLYMHDGLSRSVAHAVSRHGGAAASSRASYNDLNEAQRAQLEAFVNSL